MAATVKHLNYSTRRATYGSEAYDLSYLGDAAVEKRLPGRVRQPKPLVRKRAQEREQAKTRLRVRQQQNISPFAIAGFIAVAVFAVVLLMSYVQLTRASDDVVQLKSDLSNLKTQEAVLMAQYESKFDLTTIEEQFAAKGAMIKPQSDQVFYIDMSGPDDAVVTAKGTQGAGALENIQQFFAAAVEYFK